MSDTQKNPCETIVTLFIVLFLFLLPFYIGPTVRYIVSGLIIISIGYCISQSTTVFKKVLALPVIILSGLLVLLAFFSTYFSPEFSYSLRHAFSEYFLNWLLFFFVSAFYSINKTEKFIKWIHVANFAFALIYSAILVQWMLYPKSPLFFDNSEYQLEIFNKSDLFFLFGNACDLMTSVKHIGLFILMMFSVSMASLVLSGDRQKRKLALFLMAVNLFILFNTTRRGAMLAVFIGILFTFYVVKTCRKYLLIAITLLAVFITTFFLTGNERYIVRENWGLIFQGKLDEAIAQGGSIPLRIKTYEVFVKEIAKAPFVPKGPSMKVFRKHNPEVIKRAGLIHGHNVFIDYAVQFGLQGAVLLFLIICAQMVLFHRAFALATSCEDRITILSAGMFVLMFFTANIFADGFIHGSATLYWLFTGVATGCSMKVLNQI